MFFGCNVGANTPTENGYYFAWGETSPKSDYSSANYKFNIDNASLREAGIISGDELTEKYDAAHTNWGGVWRMPNKKEYEELKRKCKWVWKGNGYDVISKTNGNKIFIPASGYCKGTSFEYYSNDPNGSYWLSSASSTDAVSYEFYISSMYTSLFGVIRYFGNAIRPVANKQV